MNDLGKKDFINDWLLNKEPDITEKPKEIKLGCYNSTPDSRLVKQLPSVTLTKLHKMGAVYFDGGIRLLPTNQQIDSLEKFEEFLSKYVNGAKNIYIFTFINGIHPECEIIRLNKKN
ncbi:hypothetical protein [Candidatus Phytoplasma ziziphi]|uniref:hypothetical protein n=1 Tax=Ziziphus jujuba witches'-broom phytoplasma TaxID=135727 RepID=UPI001EDC9390|nr:hypothetical protein [Candidatus Phytoplasma ziziphi]